MMKLSDGGIRVIKNFEGLRLTAYRDTTGVWTIGYGSTRYQDNKVVKLGDHLTTKQQADELFSNTLTRYVNAVNKGVKVPLTQNQFDALVSFTYNLGTGVMINSTLVKKLNSGDYDGAADQFLIWNKITDPSSGKKTVSKVLSQRREQERKLFITK